MKRFIILAWLLAAQFVHGAHVKTIREDAGERYITLKLDYLGRLKRCIITTNMGQTWQLYPKDKLNSDLQNISLEYKNVIYIYFTDGVNGKWTVNLTLYGEEKNEEEKVVIKEFDIQMKDIYEERKLIPGHKINIIEGNFAIFQLPGLFPNLKSCILEYKNQEFDVLTDEYNYLKIQEPGVCGVRLEVNRSSSGYWNLYADVSTNETYYGTLYIQVSLLEDHQSPQSVKYFQLGNEEIVQFNVRNSYGITYCQLEDPNGKKIPIKPPSCSYKIPFVTKSNEGLWKVYYGIRERSIPFKADITVVTYDYLSSNVTYLQNKDINLLCRVPLNSHYGDSNCIFTRPDNLTLSVSPGVGSDRYEYYGGSNQEKHVLNPARYNCGITIRSPRKEDFGAWKCTIHLGDKIIGTILRTDNSTNIFSNKSIKAYGSQVYVPKRNSFTLRCSAEDILSYCWMLSPNGTMYTVSKKGSSPSDLTYEGSGLEFGECGAIVEVADETHQGEWSCRMGILNGTEMETKVSVTVTDSLLIADENMIEISSQKSTILNCRILPGHDNVINYCRWIRPDGRGIYNNVDNKYVTERTLSSCKLTIQELNANFDIGSWTCTVGIAGRDMMEASTQIHIKYSYVEFAGFISVGLAIALLIIITIIVFVIIVRKRRNMVPDDKKIILFK